MTDMCQLTKWHNSYLQRSPYRVLYKYQIKTTMNKLNLKEAIATMAKAGFTFVGKKRCKYDETMEYHFTKEGNTYCWTLPGLRIRAHREQWTLWMKAQAAELDRGIQTSLFSDWEIEEMCAS